MITPTERAELERLCTDLRLDVLRMVSGAGSSHVGSNFSEIELLAVLYARYLRVRPSDPTWPERDRFVLSKGHACAALYAVLARRGFFPRSLLDTFCQNGSRLAGHATAGIPGVEVSTGSLGHGLSIATGMALAAQRDGRAFRTVCLLSDGECDEGSTWEPAIFAAHHRLDGLVAIVDYNKIQSLGRVADVASLEPFADKWRAFGWATVEVDGHDLSAIDEALGRFPFEAGKPSCLIAHTVKGKGVSFMEDDLLWHYRCPRGDELAAATAELTAQASL
ncbi:MAG: transketolase [Gemmatimonadaceae bacterium]